MELEVEFTSRIENVPCATCQKQLDIGEAIKLLENYDQYPNAAYPPVKPKGGEAYLFMPSSLEDQGKPIFGH